MSNVKTKKDQLVEEFHVQIFASGRIDWDRLDGFIPKKRVGREDLVTRVKKKILGRLREVRPSPV